MEAGVADLLEAVARYAVLAVAEAERADGERSQGDLVPAVGEQDRVHLLWGYQRTLCAVHTAITSSASGTASRSSVAISVCPLASASDSGVPPQRSTGCGLAPAASRYRTTSSWPSAAARCSGVRPSQALAQWR